MTCGHDVRVCVEALGAIDWERVLSSDVVGISTTTSTAIRAYQYSERVRQAGIPVVMGGPHVTFEADGGAGVLRLRGPRRGRGHHA